MNRNPMICSNGLLYDDVETHHIDHSDMTRSRAHKCFGLARAPLFRAKGGFGRVSQDCENGQLI